jgi:hypothetical protein
MPAVAEETLITPPLTPRVITAVDWSSSLLGSRENTRQPQEHPREDEERDGYTREEQSLHQLYE